MEGLNNGDTAWMAMSCALVLFMTPGLAFFYGGLVRDSNIVNTMMMSIISMGLTTLTWMIVGFTWAFDWGWTYVGFRNLQDKTCRPEKWRRLDRAWWCRATPSAKPLSLKP